MFKAYQHYFNQKDANVNHLVNNSVSNPQVVLNTTSSSVNIAVGGNQARRGYRPLTTTGSSGGGYRHNGTADHTRNNSRSGAMHRGSNSTTSQGAILKSHGSTRVVNGQLRK